MIPHHKFVTKVLQRYWRLTRSLTLGAQAVVLDGDNRVLLIRHTYRPGWHFPGGGVERMELIETALERELFEETGVELTAKPELYGIYANFHVFPSDHVVLYLVRSWRQPHVPPPNREIAEQGFYALAALPAEINPPTRRRIAEVLEGAARDVKW